jgi:HK97 gp10 family phage protein
MMGFEVDASEQFKDIAKEEEAAFFKRGRTAVRKATTRLRNAIRRNAPKGETNELSRAFVARVRTRKREGQIIGKVQPRGRIRAKGGKWHIARFLEFGTVHIAPRGFIRRSQMEQAAAIDRDLEQAGQNVQEFGGFFAGDV